MSPTFSLVGGGIGKATVTASTGSPTIDTSSRAGKTIYKFTGSGSITVGSAGTAEILVCGGGGAGAGGAGGAGGYVYDTAAILPSGTLTVIIGSGGVADNYFGATPGTASRIGNFVAPGGGRGGNNQTSLIDGAPGGSGGSGGGGYANGYAGGAGVSGLGNNGATGITSYSAGGGGAGGAGSGQTGGAGLANSITGTSVTYCRGGSTTTTAASTANSGNGGNSTVSGPTGFVVVVIG
jgi:hypothetical protein